MGKLFIVSSTRKLEITCHSAKLLHKTSTSLLKPDTAHIAPQQQWPVNLPSQLAQQGEGQTSGPYGASGQAA